MKYGLLLVVAVVIAQSLIPNVLWVAADSNSTRSQTLEAFRASSAESMLYDNPARPDPEVWLKVDGQVVDQYGLPVVPDIPSTDEIIIGMLQPGHSVMLSDGRIAYRDSNGQVVKVTEAEWTGSK